MGTTKVMKKEDTINTVPAGAGMNLIKYAGEYWVSLADYTNTRNTKGYSNHASVKSAIRTYALKLGMDKYLAFRGEKEINNIVVENRMNPFFTGDAFQGTRIGLVSFNIIDELNSRFGVAKKYEKSFNAFIAAAKEYVKEQEEKEALAFNSAIDTTKETNSILHGATSDLITSRSTVLRQLRNEVHNIDTKLETLNHNRERLLAAINALETLQIGDA